MVAPMAAPGRDQARASSARSRSMPPRAARLLRLAQHLLLLRLKLVVGEDALLAKVIELDEGGVKIVGRQRFLDGGDGGGSGGAFRGSGGAFRGRVACQPRVSRVESP